MKAASLNSSVDQRTRLLEAATRTARAGAEYTLVLEGIAQLRRIQPAVDHDDIELCELAAMAGTFSDNEQLVDRCLACVRTSTASSDHRARAALTALKYVDVFPGPDRQDRVMEEARHIDLTATDELLRLEFDLVLQSGNGQGDRVIAAARRLIAASRDLSDVRAASLVLNAAIALWGAGAVSESIDAGHEAYALADKYGAVHLRLTAAIHLGAIEFDLGDDVQAARWRNVASTIAEMHPELTDGFEVLVAGMDVAICDKDLDVAARLMSEASSRGLFDAAIRNRWRQCFELRLDQLQTGGSSGRSAIAKFLAFHDDRIPLTSLRDLEIAIAVWDALAFDSVAESQAVLTEYFLRERRSLAPVARVLQQAIADSAFEIPQMGGLRLGALR